MAFSSGRYGAAMARYGWTCSGALCSQADGFTELDISARRGSISAPDDRRDRKGKRVKNGWPRCVT